MKQLTKSKFARNVAIVASGTAGAQAITMAFSPVITRLYGPEAFGVLGTFTAILAILTPLAALSYPIAIVLPRHDADALGLVKLSLGIAVAMSLLAGLILTLFQTQIVDVFNLHTVEPFILFLPLAMLFTASMSVMNHWVARKKLFNIKARVAVLQALWLNTAKAGIGLVAPLATVLVVLTAMSSALHSAMLFFAVQKNEKSQAFSGVPGKEKNWQKKIKNYRHLAFYRTPQEMLSASSQSLPVVFIASMFGPAAAGFYALGNMVLMMPSSLVGNSVKEVVYPKMAEKMNENLSVTGLLVKATLSLMLIGLFPLTIIVLSGPWLFGIVFGSDWTVSGQYAQWIALLVFFNLSNKPSIASIPILHLERAILVYSVVATFLRLSSIWVAYYLWGSDLSAVAFFSITCSISYIVLLAIVFIASVKRDKALE
ncbi:lipopolysaccharide biosynthesis protein [Franzmannia pantelleriensis]|nr:oligosaccharide flippase family protein [Halomonas pantelleriensis]